MLEGSVKVINHLGLHARAAAELVRLAKKFKSRITIVRADATAYANAKSMLSVLALAASFGTTLELYVEGEDETAAFEAVKTLFANGIGEL